MRDRGPKDWSKNGITVLFVIVFVWMFNDFTDLTKYFNIFSFLKVGILFDIDKSELNFLK